MIKEELWSCGISTSLSALFRWDATVKIKKLLLENAFLQNLILTNWAWRAYWENIAQSFSRTDCKSDWVS